MKSYNFQKATSEFLKAKKNANMSFTKQFLYQIYFTFPAVKKLRSLTSVKPYVSGESCYEQHMQENFADLQRHQFWGLMLSGAAGHTYGAAGIWHMGVPEEHGTWGGWNTNPMT